jgi:hypothetical protein
VEEALTYTDGQRKRQMDIKLLFIKQPSQQLRGQLKRNGKTYNDDDDDNVICTMNSDYKITVTLYSIQAWFVLVYISVNALHKGDDDDDDDDDNDDDNDDVLLFQKLSRQMRSPAVSMRTCTFQSPTTKSDYRF